jgi:hypothetical protein
MLPLLSAGKRLAYKREDCMVKKKKFKPVVTKIKLNPEQAVLQCSCYNTGFYARGGMPGYNWSNSRSTCANGGKSVSNMAFQPTCGNIGGSALSTASAASS